MEANKKERIQKFLTQIQDMCNNLLDNLYTLGNDVDKKCVKGLTYSPLKDIVYVYCSDEYSGSVLLFELKEQFKDNQVDIKRISSDQVNGNLVIELEFESKAIIDLNKKENKTEYKSIDNRHL